MDCKVVHKSKEFKAPAFLKEFAKFPPKITSEELRVTECTLLSKEEAEQYLTQKQRHELTGPSGYWWLRSASDADLRKAYAVDSRGNISEMDVSFSFRIVPALRIENLEESGINVGDVIETDFDKWSVISKDLAVCVTSLGIHPAPFNLEHNKPDASDYEKSDIKKVVDTWAKNNGIEISEEPDITDEPGL